MNSCMIAHATRQEEDLARDEWFRGRGERTKKKTEELEAVERRRDIVIGVQRSWEERERERERDVREKGGGGRGPQTAARER